MFRNSSTYFYLAVFLGLLCYVTFIDKKLPGTKEQEEADTQLFKLDPEDVNRLEIANSHGVFIFQRKNNHWEIKKPVNALADAPTVDGIIGQISYAQPRQVIKPDKFNDGTLKEWGLAPTPAERVILNTKDKQYELLVGRKVAINDSVYARASGRKNEDVRIIPSTIKEVLEKDLSDFRSRSVFDFEIDKVTKVATRTADTATTPGQQCEIDLKDGIWALQMPLIARASATDVQNLLNKILAEHAVDFITDDSSNLSQYGLTSPSATLTVTVQPDDELVLQIGGAVPNKPDQVYAQRLKSNSVFTLTRSSVDELLNALPNVRDRHVLPFTPSQITGLGFSFGTKKGQLRSDHGLWSTIGDAEGRANISKIMDVLTKLSQLETTPALKDSATDLKTYGLDKPQGKITIESPTLKPGPSVSLLIGKDVNKLLYVRNSTEPFIYTIPDDALNFLPANNLELRDARVINLMLKDVTGMTITSGSGPAIVLTRSEGGTWSVQNVKERMADSVRAETQASLFSQLQAKTWLGPAQPSYGLSKPALTVSLQTNEKNPVVLKIGNTLPTGGRAAQVQGESSVFEIAEGDYGLLNASSLLPIPKVLAPTNTPPVTPAPAMTNAAPVTPKK